MPVKFTLGGDYGLDVFADGYPVSQDGQCDGAPSDPVETTSSANSGLAYDACYRQYSTTGRPQAVEGQCRTLILQFCDGQELKADFKFK